MVKTRSEQFLESRGNLPPLVTNSMVKSVSSYRRESLENETRNGAFREPGTYSNLSSDDYKNTSLGVASATIHKRAQLGEFGSAPGATGSAGNNWRGPGGTVRQGPEVYSPLWLNSNLNLPRDRATINAWCRTFFALNPMVHNAISLHSTYPISKLNIHCKDKRVEQFFADMIDELDLMNVCCQIAQEFWTLGEAFVYTEFDEINAKWSRIVLQNPDYITVKRSVIAGEPIISLRPDENLKRIVTSNRPSDIQQRRQLDPSIIEHVKRNENIPLNNFYVSHLARKISPYEIRGTGVIVPCFRALMLMDKIKESKYVQADSLINPITLIKIGSENYKPTPADIDVYREMFEQAEGDKNFKIFSQEAVSIERIGAQGGIIDTTNDISQLIKEIYIGLMVPQVLMDGGSDTTYANGGVALDILKQRYTAFRNMLSAWLRRKIFAPIAEINNFYEMVEGKKKLIIPEVDWNHMSLFDVESYINALTGLATSEKKSLSLHTLYRSLGVEWEDEQRKIREEAIDEAIAAKEKTVLEKMPLNELRALNSESEIKESIEAALPGEQNLPGEEMNESSIPETPLQAPPPPPPQPIIPKK